ncbi:VOC family protein [Arthrobacter russicus]|uniref:Uncharacterized protein n=1 Tax=Arthrobacter russicus TaxID=172040 RepID=A0ABU1JEI6_9MICC|nr:VOC family protein [Arthrobacter russicus]MDR6269826.1 hypothetical protein [Arthrobacter russicus]
MLRARPIHFTSRVEAFLPIFDLLGLASGYPDEDWYEFDAGSGRIALHLAGPGTPHDGTTCLGFEARDLDVFAEQTMQAGSKAETVDLDHGRAVRVTGCDGLEFVVDRAERLETDLAADPRLSVNMIWLTPDVAGASQDLRNIGARWESSSVDGRISGFSAKNGGRILAHFADEPAHGGLGFGYDGDLEELLDKFLAAGIGAHIIDENYGRTLHVPNPDFADVPHNPTGPTIWINEENQGDGYGYLDHRSTTAEEPRG